MAMRRTFHRPMEGWWRRDPFFLRYMAREATAPFVAVYAIVLLVGIVRLAQGEAAYTEWVESLRSPTSIALHAGLVAIFAYHTLTWFLIMPKTMPPIAIGGRKLGPAAITSAGIAVAALLSLGIWLLVSHAAP
jgi:succinate dehydrogenase subunit C